jgi:hypothetical protein
LQCGDLNITGITDGVTAANTQTFTYSPANRLSSAGSAGSYGSQSWTYDGVGNRLSELSAGASKSSGETDQNFFFIADRDHKVALLSNVTRLMTGCGDESWRSLKRRGRRWLSYHD